MQREAGAHLWDASEAAKLIQEFSSHKSSLAEFQSDLIIRSAIERQLEVLGEALNRLRRDDADTGSRVPEIDKIIGMRNILAHEYGAIDYEIVWSAATTRVPKLIPVLEELVKEAQGAAGI
ncbi:MAG: HepT-like ribonuclease domain-containing protein [Brevibacterium sp.]